MVRYDTSTSLAPIIVPPPDERLAPDDTPWPDPDPEPLQVLMFHEQENFPSLQPFVKDRSRHAPKIPNAQSPVLLSNPNL